MLKVVIDFWAFCWVEKTSNLWTQWTTCCSLGRCFFVVPNGPLPSSPLSFVLEMEWSLWVPFLNIFSVFSPKREKRPLAHLAHLISKFFFLSIFGVYLSVVEIRWMKNLGKKNEKKNIFEVRLVRWEGRKINYEPRYFFPNPPKSFQSKIKRKLMGMLLCYMLLRRLGIFQW